MAVWAAAFLMLAVAAAIPEGPSAALSVDNAYPTVGEVVHFDASASVGHDAGNGRIVAYRFAFGDGQETDWLNSPRTGHAYESAENVTATVTVVDLRGQTGTATAAVHVGVSPPFPPGTPDLVPIRLIVTPARPRVNDTVNLTVVILNRGNANATSATVDAYDDRPNGTVGFIGRLELSRAIPSSASESLRFPMFLASDPGNHTIRAIVANVTPVGANATAHELDLTFEVVAGPSQPGTNQGGGPTFEVGGVVVVLAAAAVAAMAGAGYLLMRRPPKGPLEPPPHQPPDQSPPPIWPP